MPENPITMESRGSGLLPRQIAGFIFEDIANTSAIQRVFPEQPLPVEGLSIPVMTGRPTAQWVSETGRKPVSDAAIDFVTMDPEKIAVIVPFSEEFTRADRVNLFEMLRPAIAESFAVAFDWAAIMGANSVGGQPGGAGSPFAAHLAQTTKTVTLGTADGAEGGVYADLVDVIAQMPAGKRLSGWVFAEVGEATLMLAVDTNGRPILTQTDRNPGGLSTNIIGRPFDYSEAFAVDTTGDGGTTPSNALLGIGGDVRQARWGRGLGIRYNISREATIFKSDDTPLSAFQDNLVFLRAEAEFGWVINDLDAFVKVYPSGTTFA